MKCCVVGCGAAGIIAAKHLKQAGIEFDVFEMTDDIGGTWIYTEKEKDSFGNLVHTSMYKNLRTNLPKEIMEFEGLKFARKKSFIESSEVYNYLKNFVNKNKLMDHVKLGYEVKNVSHHHDNWEVTVKDLKSNVEMIQHYHSIMVCNGHYFKPRIPKLEGQDIFEGLQMHTKTYRVPDTFKDKNLLVIGFGPSGQDITVDASKEAKKIFLSHHAKHFEAESFPKNVISKPDVIRLNHNSVVFQDGSTENIDAILYCTGYYYYFPFLDESCEITVDDNYVRPLYRQVLNIKHPSMAFIGLPFKTFIFPLFEVQVRAFVKLLLGQSSLPKENKMLEELKRFEEDKIKRNIPKRKYHMLDSVQDYVHQLNSMSDLKDLPLVLYKIYDYNAQRRFDSFVQYRMYEYHIINENDFCVNIEVNKDDQI